MTLLFLLWTEENDPILWRSFFPSWSASSFPRWNIIINIAQGYSLKDIFHSSSCLITSGYQCAIRVERKRIEIIFSVLSKLNYPNISSRYVRKTGDPILTSNRKHLNTSVISEMIILSFIRSFLFRQRLRMSKKTPRFPFRSMSLTDVIIQRKSFTRQWTFPLSWCCDSDYNNNKSSFFSLLAWLSQWWTNKEEIHSSLPAILSQWTSRSILYTYISYFWRW